LFRTFCSITPSLQRERFTNPIPCGVHTCLLANLELVDELIDQHKV